MRHDEWSSLVSVVWKWGLKWDSALRITYHARYHVADVKSLILNHLFFICCHSMNPGETLSPAGKPVFDLRFFPVVNGYITSSTKGAGRSSRYLMPFPGLTSIARCDQSSCYCADPSVRDMFESEAGIELQSMFNAGRAGSLQSVRSFGLYSARVLQDYLRARTEHAEMPLETVLNAMNASHSTISRYSDVFRTKSLQKAVEMLSEFDTVSIKLVQAFYKVRAKEIEPIL